MSMVAGAVADRAERLAWFGVAGGWFGAIRADPVGAHASYPAVDRAAAHGPICVADPMRTLMWCVSDWWSAP